MDGVEFKAMNKKELGTVTFERVFLSVFFLVPILIWWCFLFLGFGYGAAGQDQLKKYLLLAILPLLFVVPIIISVFAAGKVSKKWIGILLALAVVLPTLVWLQISW